MKNLILIALCFLAINLKAQTPQIVINGIKATGVGVPTLTMVLTAGNGASHKNINNVNRLKIDEITSNDLGSGLEINTIGTKPINIISSKNLTLQSLSGTININPNGSAGIILNSYIGIGQGSNPTPLSPISCTDYPIFTSQNDAITNGNLGEGDHWKKEVSGDWYVMVVHIP